MVSLEGQVTPRLPTDLPMTSVEVDDTGKPLVKLPIYSATQIETWEDCPRKWGFDKLDRLPKSSHKSAKLGTAVHTQLERYLKGGSFDFTSTSLSAEERAGEDHAGHSAHLATEAIPYLPKPGSDLLEVELCYLCELGKPHTLHQGFLRQIGSAAHYWTGRIDWRQVLDRVVVGDHKTTSSPQYIKTPLILQTDIQANVYAMDAFTEWSVPEVDLQWTYILTRGARKAVPVKATLKRPRVMERFAEIDAIASTIDRVRTQVKSAIELPYNPDACHKYGGCPYQHKCNLSPFEALRPMSMSLLDQLKANQAQQAQQAQQAAPMPAPVQQAPQFNFTPAATQAAPAPQAHEDLYSIAMKDSRGVVTHDFTGRPLPPALIEQIATTGHIPNPSVANSYIPLRPLTQMVAQYLSHYAGQYTPAPVAPPAQQFSPPGAFAPPGMVAPPAATPTFHTPTAINPPEFQPPPLNPAQQVAQTPVAAPAVEAPKAKRGRKSNAEKAAEAAAAAAGNATIVSPPALAGVVATVEVNTPEYDATSLPIRTLYINCRRVKTDDDAAVLEISDIMAYVNEQIKVDLKVDDYRFIDYGKGGGAVALYAEKYVNNLGGNFDVAIDTSAHESNLMLARLSALASNVVRGF